MSAIKVCRFVLYSRHAGSSDEPWPEPYEKATSDPKQWCIDTIQRFNDTLKRGEKPREFVRCEVIEADADPAAHNWSKTNLVTIEARGVVGAHDVMRCENCGITGKRFGLGGIRLDSQFRGKVYRNCRDTKAHQAKKAAAKDRRK